jgi:hypothetical protein
MQWKNKKGVALAGDERTVVLFAYFPIPCNNGHMHWLEKVKVRQFWGACTKTWRPISTKGEFGLVECYCPNKKEKS